MLAILDDPNSGPVLDCLNTLYLQHVNPCHLHPACPRLVAETDNRAKRRREQRSRRKAGETR